jgi:hypothetical protein
MTRRQQNWRGEARGMDVLEVNARLDAFIVRLFD